MVEGSVTRIRLPPSARLACSLSTAAVCAVDGSATGPLLAFFSALFTTALTQLKEAAWHRRLRQVRQRARHRWTDSVGKRSRKRALRDFLLLQSHHGSRPNLALLRSLKMWQCYFCNVINGEKAVRCKKCRGWWEECWINTSRAKSTEKKSRKRSKSRQAKEEGTASDPLKPFGTVKKDQKSEPAAASAPWASTTPARKIAVHRAEETTEAEKGSYTSMETAKMKQNLEVLKTALGDSAPEEVALSLQQLDQSIPTAAKVSEENSLNASHLYKLLNAKKQMERARNKVQELDAAWKSFQSTIAKRIQEQKESYTEQRAAALQIYQTKVQRLQEAEKELKSKTAEAGALSIDEDASDAMLQEMLLRAQEQDVEPLEIDDDSELSKEIPDLRPFKRFGNATSPKRKLEEPSTAAEALNVKAKK